MEKNQLEFMLVRPTALFIEQLELTTRRTKRINPKLIEIDQSGYLIKHYQTISETVDTIERHYQTIFLNEAQRWLGNQFQLNGQPSFLDFSNCFELSFYQNVYFFSMSPSEGQLVAVRVTPTTELTDWLVSNQLLLSNSETNTNALGFQDNSSIAIFRIKTLDELSQNIYKHYLTLMELERTRLALSCLPSINCYQRFQKFFTVNIHQYIRFIEKSMKKLGA